MSLDAFRSILESLRQRRVGVDVAADLLSGNVPQLCQGQFGEQLGDVMADQRGTEKLAVAGVGDDLHETGTIA